MLCSSKVTRSKRHLHAKYCISLSSIASNGILYQAISDFGHGADRVQQSNNNMTNEATERLRLRVEQPVEGIKCIPHSFLRENEETERYWATSYIK